MHLVARHVEPLLRLVQRSPFCFNREISPSHLPDTIPRLLLLLIPHDARGFFSPSQQATIHRTAWIWMQTDNNRCGQMRTLNPAHAGEAHFAASVAYDSGQASGELCDFGACHWLCVLVFLTDVEQSMRIPASNCRPVIFYLSVEGYVPIQCGCIGECSGCLRYRTKSIGWLSMHYHPNLPSTLYISALLPVFSYPGAINRIANCQTDIGPFGSSFTPYSQNTLQGELNTRAIRTGLYGRLHIFLL